MDYHNRETKDDHRYVKYVARLFTIVDGEQFERVLSYHKCTAEDWDSFSPPNKSSFDSFSVIKKDPKRAMYCIDDADLDAISIYGNERNENYSRLEVILVPCNYVHSYMGYEGDSVHPECIADREK